MKDIVKDAMEHEEEEQYNEEAVADDPEEFGSPQIVVVGAGGAGNNTVNRLHSIGVEGADIVAVNTDKQHLQAIDADTKILVGKSLTEGLGAGGDPDMGKRATEMAQSTLRDVLGDADLVFVTAGLGGGTGTGAAPVVSKIAKDEGAIVVGMVSTPFDVERERLEKAQVGLNRLEEEADSIIVLDNNRLVDYVPDLPIGKAFSVMDQIIAETVKGISETITRPSLINLDYADMSNIMDQGGVAVMLVGETQEKNKTDAVVNDALNHPLLDVDYRGASGGLVHITGGPDLSLKQAQGIAEQITQRVDDNANIIWGSRIQEDYKGKVRVMAIMTGVDSDKVVNPQSKVDTPESGGDVGTAAGGFGDEGVPDTDSSDNNGIDRL